MDTLKVLARAGLLVLDVEHAKVGGHRAYVGRRTVRAWKLDDLPEGVPRHEHHNEFLENGQSAIPHCAYPATSFPAEVANTSYYRKLVKKGALWPFDEPTALACGVAFDPTYGGEYPALTKSAARRSGGKESEA